jgi:hypothetical protein
LKCFKIAHNKISLIWGDIKNERLCNGNASSSFWDVIRVSWAWCQSYIFMKKCCRINCIIVVFYTLLAV